MTRPHLAVLGCVVSIAIALRAERLPIRKFTIADGLPHDSVNSIYCDSRGLLWFATREGLARFDGNRFRNLESVLLAGARMVTHHTLSPGAFVAFNLYLAMLVTPLRSLGMWIGQAQRATAAGAEMGAARGDFKRRI